MKTTLPLLLLLTFSSCIPLSIAPTIKEDKLMIAKRLKRKLPKQYALIFEDPKNANEFYDYIKTKFSVSHGSAQFNVPFKLKNQDFYFSFFEVERSTKTINFVALVADAALENNNIDPMFDDAYTSRTGHWYVVMMIEDKQGNDCLNSDYPLRNKLVLYLQELRKEYLNTQNYLSIELQKP